MIAVITPTSNHFQELRESFDSLYAQEATFDHFIIDRGSRDDVTEWLWDFRDKGEHRIADLDFVGRDLSTSRCINIMIERILEEQIYDSIVIMAPYIEFEGADVLARVGRVGQHAVCSPIIEHLQVGESIEVAGERLRLCGASSLCIASPAEMWQTLRVPEEETYGRIIHAVADPDYGLPVGCVEGTRANVIHADD